MRHVFIQANDKQALGARLAAYAIRRNLKEPSALPITVINVDREPAFRAFAGRTYLRNGREVVHDAGDLQSFTLSRFLPPERMGYRGMALVIDPDIFALCDVNDLFDLGTGGKAIAACRKKLAWDSSVMLLDCGRLRHWKVGEWLERLAAKELDYDTIMTLKMDFEDVQEIPRAWNSLDALTEGTRMLHATGRLTQPWKTGLPIDFTMNPMPKIFGLVPREPIHRLLGRIPSTYQPHPDPNIEAFFFGLLRAALDDGAVTRAEVEEEIRLKHVRPDLLERAA